MGRRGAGEGHRRSDLQDHCGLESCSKCGGWQITPRTAAALWSAAQVLSDHGYDDVEATDGRGWNQPSRTLPHHPDDLDWDTLSDNLFQDHDILELPRERRHRRSRQRRQPADRHGRLPTIGVVQSLQQHGTVRRPPALSSMTATTVRSARRQARPRRPRSGRDVAARSG